MSAGARERFNVRFVQKISFDLIGPISIQTSKSKYPSFMVYPIIPMISYQDTVAKVYISTRTGK